MVLPIFLAQVFGDCGKHARSAVGVSSLIFDMLPAENRSAERNVSVGAEKISASCRASKF